MVVRPFLEWKDMYAIIQKKDKGMLKKGKIFENLGKKCTQFENILEKGR